MLGCAARHGCEYLEVAARAQSNNRILGQPARVHAAEERRNPGKILKSAAAAFKVVTDPHDVIKRLIHGMRLPDLSHGSGHPAGLVNFTLWLMILSLGATCPTGSAGQRCSLGRERRTVDFVSARYGKLITEIRRNVGARRPARARARSA